MTEPLPRGQQILLQRLMAEHIMTDEKAEDVLKELEEEDEVGVASRSLSQCFASINRQLTRGFGMEIATMVENGEKLHAVINQHADNVAKESFSTIVGHHERAYCRLILEALVEGPSARSTLINLRTELKDPLKMDLDKADKCLETWLEEHYLAHDAGDTRRRDSVSAKITLGPRAFLELSHTLTDMGFPKEELPQFVFHR